MRASASEQGTRGHSNIGLRALIFLAVLVVIAYGEELLWDRLVWQERAWLFGGAWSWGRQIETLLVPLLALPQLTHYFLDGFIWRRRANVSYGAASSSS